MVGLEGSADPVTHDAFFRGRLVLAQRRRGYRTNVDALWLAAFAAGRKPARVLDLGSGVGIVGLALYVNGHAREVAAVDVDDEVLALARDNGARAGLGVETVLADLRSALPRALWSRFDLVVANPPYDTTAPSPDAARARARTGDRETLTGFVRAARAALSAESRACFVYPVRELARLLGSLRAVGLEPKRLRLVHPLPDEPASVALVEAKPARPGGLRVEPPLVAMTAPGVWSAEARSILDGVFGTTNTAQS